MKKLFFIAFLAAVLIIPTIAAAEEFTVGEPRDTEGIELEKEAPVNWGSLRYWTVTPRRCLNTQTAFGIIPGGSTVDVRLDLACNIPFPTAKAVHINMAVFNATGPGNLRAYAFGDPLPFAAVLNYGTIPGLFAISNAAIIPLCGQFGCAWDIRFWVSRTCNFIVDALGYFRG